MRLSAGVAVVCMLFLSALGAVRAGAEPIDVTIPITSGSVSFNPNIGEGTSPLQLYGDGFSLVARPESGVTGPGCCIAPGATTSFRAYWVGNDLQGTATYNGQTYSDVGGLISPNSAGVQFLSSPFTLPSFDGSTTSITIAAPFTLDGFFQSRPGSGSGANTLNATLVGGGMGTILFTLAHTSFTAWEPRAVSLQIGATDAVPEPSSIVLVCLSLIGVYAGTRYRRSLAQ